MLEIRQSGAVVARCNRPNFVDVEALADLWTSCFTPRELRLLCDRAGLDVDEVRSVTPGDYAPGLPDLEHPEFLVLGRRQAVSGA